ncbi:single-stranded-DNA-specific exonuclease RecJ [Candidatus Saccharibacteria bacterium]|nr:single-stranded-DNA-specific exonuclease RecJ [Candidatus Saccharibacteria bacterium]
MSNIFEQLLKKRHFDQDFLHPKYEAGINPFELADMDKAVERIKLAQENREKILIYGDYDVDGVTSSAAMRESLINVGINPDDIEVMLPDRFADGYGMSPKLIKHAKKQGASLVITVDCGSRNHTIIDELNELKIDTIVTDHHETDERMPNAVAVINPHRKDNPTDSLKNLAGVGVVYKLAEALVDKHMIKAGQEKWLLDLVLLGTICDSMLLTGDNRRLGFYGMKVLAKTRRPGLIELMTRAGVKCLDSESIGFQIGPRLNAAGRLDTADLSLNLICANNPIEAAPIAEKLEQLNKKRKTEQTQAMREIEKRGISDDPVIIETGKWHEGILGIVAGHLVETYHRPAFVLTETTENVFKGSGRSFGDFNLADALSFAKDSIIGGGGHAAAAGVKVSRENLYKFREQINEYYRSLHLTNQTDYLKQHADLTLDDFSEINLDLLDELRQLEPYGPGNEEPIFRLKNINLTNVTRMGTDRNHLRLDLRDKNGKYLKLVAFYAPEQWLNLDPQFDRIEPLIRLTENDFNGVKSVEARLLDLDILQN